MPQRDDALDGRVARDWQPRDLTDPRAMRALAHPLRIKLLELLMREGPLTATRAGHLLDESPGNMSWHLQTLARYGFVEETGGSRGRARPWRLVSVGTRFSGTTSDDPASAAALERLFYERSFAEVIEWLAVRESYPLPWRDQGFATDLLTYLTPDELTALGHQVTELLLQYRDRTLDRGRRPEGSHPVRLVSFGHPAPATESGN